MQEIVNGSTKPPSARNDAYIDFVEALLQSGNEWSLPAAEFFVAHLLTGIQPGEWPSVRRWTLGDDEKLGLWVLVPANIGSLYPFTRKTIMLDKDDVHLVNLIDRHIARIQRCTTDEEVEAFCGSCERFVRKVASRTIQEGYEHPSLEGKKKRLSKQQREAIIKLVCHHRQEL